MTSIKEHGTNDGHMLDTSAFNSVLDGIVPITALEGFRLFATHIQRDELAATSNKARRDTLLALFHTIGADELPTESAVWDVSEWGKAKWSIDDGVYESLRKRIRELDGKNRGANQIKDALIAETAIKAGLVLVTTDKNLAQVVGEHGGRVEDMDVFRRSGEV